jgi:hypothetical protein
LSILGVVSAYKYKENFVDLMIVANLL